MSRCPICDPSCRFARPTGPTSARLLAIGEKPGRVEAFRGQAFQGDTGIEVDRTYLPLAGLERDDIRVSNTVKCWLGSNNNKPTPEQIDGCARYWLPDEVAELSNPIIMLLGATPCSLVPKIDLQKDHGLPIWCDQADHQGYFGEWEGYLWPSFHPAAALHDTGMMTPLLEDFERLGKWLKGTWHPPKPPASQIRYLQLESKRQLWSAMDTCAYDWLPVDTENDGKRPWSLQFSPQPGEGYLIPADSSLLATFAEAARHLSGLIYHNAVHDLDVEDAMGEAGRRLARMPFRDTMQEAYQLGNLPQGLKALGWRLLGIRMVGWEDVVMPWSRKVAVRWLTDQWLEATEERQEVVTKYQRPKKPSHKKLPASPVWNEDRTLIIGSREWKPGERERGLKRIIGHSHKPEYDIWEKELELYTRLNPSPFIKWADSPMPQPSIAHVPKAEALHYAIQDADVTGQVAQVLEQRREEIVQKEWRVVEEDWDQ